MSIIQDILDYNGEFVKGKEYETFVSSKFPDKKIAVVTCMDTRLTELLPAAMNFKNGDIKIIKTAGGIITHPFGSVMRSLLIAVYELGVEDIIIIGHHECGMQSIDSELMIEKMKERGICEKDLEVMKFSGINVEKYFRGFEKVEDSVNGSVSVVTNHPLIPSDINIYGCVMDPNTGKLELINNREKKTTR